jgi:hypothetical protein
MPVPQLSSLQPTPSIMKSYQAPKSIACPRAVTLKAWPLVLHNALAAITSTALLVAKTHWAELVAAACQQQSIALCASELCASHHTATCYSASISSAAAVCLAFFFLSAGASTGGAFSCTHGRHLAESSCVAS